MTDILEIAGLEPNSSVPLYRQLQMEVRRSLSEKKLKPSDALPAERDIAEQLSVSRVTVRKALDGLVEEGLLERRHGSGTYVADTIHKSLSSLTSFTEDMQLRGRTPSSKWLLRESRPATFEEMIEMGLESRSQVCHLHRIRLADEEPMSIEFSTVPESLLKGHFEFEGSLFEELARPWQSALPRVAAPTCLCI